MSTMDLTTQPPSSEQAEEVVLGSLITAPHLLADIARIITPDDFYQPRNAAVMEAVEYLDSTDAPIEMASVITRLRDSGELTKVGGPETIARLVRQSSPQNSLYYARVLAEKAAKRRLIALHVRGMKNSQDGSNMGLKELIEDTQKALDGITKDNLTSEVVQVGDVLAATIDRIEELGKHDGGVTGVPTGFVDLDRATYGLHPGQMIVVAARPGVGKSTLGLDFCRAAAIKHGITSAIFSLEMSAEEINMRLLASQAGVELGHIRSGRVSEAEWDRIGKHQQKIADAPLFIDDTASNTMSQIRQKCRRLKQQHNLGLVVIDYMQLMQGDRRAESRQQEVSEISRSIKLMAKELKVPVVAMSQLNRQSENRSGDSRPRVSDLRESGSIEQDADVVMLIHREEVSNPDTPRVGEADLILGKQRAAAQGQVLLGWQGAYSRFVDPA